VSQSVLLAAANSRRQRRLESTLSRRGFKVVAASTSEEAASYLRLVSFDLIVLHAVPWNRDVREVMEACAALGQCGALVVTGKLRRRAEAYRRGAALFIPDDCRREFTEEIVTLLASLSLVPAASRAIP